MVSCVPYQRTRPSPVQRRDEASLCTTTPGLRCSTRTRPPLYAEGVVTKGRWDACSGAMDFACSTCSRPPSCTSACRDQPVLRGDEASLYADGEGASTGGWGAMNGMEGRASEWADGALCAGSLTTVRGLHLYHGVKGPSASPCSRPPCLGGFPASLGSSSRSGSWLPGVDLGGHELDRWG